MGTESDEVLGSGTEDAGRVSSTEGTGRRVGEVETWHEETDRLVDRPRADLRDTSVLFESLSREYAVWTHESGVVPAGKGEDDWQIACTGDFDGDGAREVMWSDSSSMLAFGHLEAGERRFALAPIGHTFVGVADFDADGASDVLWRGPERLVMWFRGSPEAAATVDFPLDSTWSVLGVGDVDGDGGADIVLRRGGSTQTWYMRGASRLAVRSDRVNEAWTYAGIGDVDGDGHDDIVWRESNGAVRVWLTGISTTTSGPFALDGVIELVRDLDGDGKSDLLVRDKGGCRSGQTISFTYQKIESIWKNGNIAGSDDWEKAN